MSTDAIRLRRDERWLDGIRPSRRFSSTMALIALASIFGHALVVGTAFVSGGGEAARHSEVSVELVAEIPRTEAPKAKRPDPTKVARVATATPKTEPVEPKTARPDAPKPEARVPDHRKMEVAKHEAARPMPKREPPAAPKLEAEEQKLSSLQKELDSLRAEQAALAAERAAAAPRSVGLRDAGLGPLPDSFQAVALPAAGEGDGEAVGYKDIVFSALAKAKGIGAREGLPGSAGVHFEVDAAGRLLSVELIAKSGVPALDAEALDIVRRAAPFPPPPQGAQRSFDANVNFVSEAAR